jgi:hypothetical protein
VAQHVVAVREMLRVAPEARLYPLIGFHADASHAVGTVVEFARRNAISTQVVEVSYRFLRGATRMLVLRRGGGPTRK